jgi:hypothetical protein
VGFAEGNITRAQIWKDNMLMAVVVPLKLRHFRLTMLFTSLLTKISTLLSRSTASTVIPFFYGAQRRYRMVKQ